MLSRTLQRTIIAGIVSSTMLSIGSAQAKDKDPYMWLEDVESEQALTWVREHNDATLATLTADARYEPLKKELADVILAADRIPYGSLMAGYVYNFWQDDQHVRGIWRRASLADYAKSEIPWETVLDLDDLASREKENWVWKSASCLGPRYERCLIALSRGGKDAAVVREFDLTKRAFVEDGFKLPEAKTEIRWIDLKTVIVGTDWGAGSLTSSGYPREARLWQRGTNIAEAKPLFRGEESDVAVWGKTLRHGSLVLPIVQRVPSFFESQDYIVSAAGDLTRIPLPDDAELQGLYRHNLLYKLRSDLAVGKKTISAGSVVSVDSRDLSAPPSLVFEPGQGRAVESVSITSNALYLNVLENVSARLIALDEQSGAWQTTDVPLPAHGSVSVVGADPFAPELLVDFQSFLIAPSLYQVVTDTHGATVTSIRSQPSRFDASAFSVEQHFAISKDGTKVPYYVVRPKAMQYNGANPTLLYGYGGFEVSLLPSYLSATGKGWLERGGVYVLANIRGGGELGPAWHRAALLKNRQRAYDDFIAVAEDLIAKKVTSPRRLGIMGGSNGGLLVGAVMVQRPELMNAVVCQVPLLDMLRYHKLLAGASWMGEYGNPDDPEMTPVLKAYSPYQNLRPGVKYPTPFFLTSTKDDRVHPGHARKMAARMEEYGEPFFYYENIEGGHGAAATLQQRVMRQALEFTYLYRRLMD